MKIKFKINLKPVVKYILLTLVSSFLISSILVSLPLTERISEKLSFNLTTKDSLYWSEEYILKLETTNPKDVRKTKEILFERLRNFGVERIAIYAEEGEENTTKLRVIVNTTKDKEHVGQLISNRFVYKLVTRKEDVDFDDPENPYTFMMGENYNPTDWDFSDFRSVYIPKTKLRSGDGEYRYFAIFKLWPKKEKELKQFLTEHQGQIIGVDLDGFVTPYQVPTVDPNATRYEAITIPVYAETEEGAKVISLLYNSGHIPTSYTLESNNELNPHVVKIDYIKLTIGIGISLIAAYLYLLIFQYSSKKVLLKSFMATIVTIALYVSYLKLTHIPVDTFLLAIEIILTTIMIRAIIENKDAELFLITVSIAIFIIIVLLGTGLMTVFAKDMIALVALSKLSMLLTEWYIDNVRKI